MWIQCLSYLIEPIRFLKILKIPLQTFSALVWACLRNIFTALACGLFSNEAKYMYGVNILLFSFRTFRDQVKCTIFQSDANFLISQHPTKNMKIVYECKVLFYLNRKLPKLYGLVGDHCNCITDCLRYFSLFALVPYYSIMPFLRSLFIVACNRYVFALTNIISKPNYNNKKY